MLNSLERILGKQKTKQLKGISSSVRVAKQMRLHWDEIFQGRMAKDLTFSYYRYFKLGITTTNPCWITEIKAHEALIIEKCEKCLRRKGVVRSIHIQFKSKEEAVIVEKPTENISFEKKIIRENESKRKRGEKLCQSCQAVYTTHPHCLFCKCENSKVKKT